MAKIGYLFTLSLLTIGLIILSLAILISQTSIRGESRISELARFDTLTNLDNSVELTTAKLFDEIFDMKFTLESDDTLYIEQTLPEGFPSDSKNSKIFGDIKTGELKTELESIGEAKLTLEDIDPNEADNTRISFFIKPDDINYSYTEKYELRQPYNNPLTSNYVRSIMVDPILQSDISGYDILIDLSSNNLIIVDDPLTVNNPNFGSGCYDVKIIIFDKNGEKLNYNDGICLDGDGQDLSLTANVKYDDVLLTEQALLELSIINDDNEFKGNLVINYAYPEEFEILPYYNPGDPQDPTNRYPEISVKTGIKLNREEAKAVEIFYAINKTSFIERLGVRRESFVKLLSLIKEAFSFGYNGNNEGIILTFHLDDLIDGEIIDTSNAGNDGGVIGNPPINPNCVETSAGTNNLGNCLEFDGGSLVQVNGDFIGEQGTISWWQRFTDTTMITGSTRRVWGYDNKFEARFEVNGVGEGRLYIDLCIDRDSEYTGDKVSLSSNILTDNDNWDSGWHLITLHWSLGDGGGEKILRWEINIDDNRGANENTGFGILEGIDGMDQATRLACFNNPPAPNLFSIGTSTGMDDVQERFKGLIDEFRILNYQIQQGAIRGFEGHYVQDMQDIDDPTFSITYNSGQILDGRDDVSGTIDIKVDVTPQSGSNPPNSATIRGVEFYFDGEFIHTEYNPPPYEPRTGGAASSGPVTKYFLGETGGTPNGFDTTQNPDWEDTWVTLKVVAYDNWGAKGETSVTFKIDNNQP